jgi:membrane associated rhomboid family serine protease
MIPVRNPVPIRFPPLANYTLIGVNIVVFLYQIGLPQGAQEAMAYVYGLVPARYGSPAWAMQVGLDPTNYLPFVTNTFMHGGWLHLILNMWTLWLFGGAVEDRMGSWRYLIFYLLCGLAGSIGHAWFNLDSTVPVVGASGAIAGVSGAYLRLFPWARIVILVPIVFIPLFFTVPAILYLGLWFALQVLQGTLAELAPTAGGIAWWAHIGGFVVGFLLVHAFTRSPRAYRPYYPDEGVLGFHPRGDR